MNKTLNPYVKEGKGLFRRLRKMKKILLVGVFLLGFFLVASVASAQGIGFGLNLPFFSFGLGLGSPYYGGYRAPYYRAPYFRPYYRGYGPGYYGYRAPYYR